MEPQIDLSYYQRIFGSGHPGWAGILGALADELDSYGDLVGPRVLEQDAVGLTKLRHEHHPLVVNLGLVDLQGLETQLRESLGESGGEQETLVRTFSELCHRSARVLRDRSLVQNPNAGQPQDDPALR